MKYAKVIFGSDWHYGKKQKSNLDGTVRTLDDVDGETELEMGIANPYEFSELDDSKSLIIEADGKVNTRNEESVDLYLMTYTDNGCYGYRCIHASLKKKGIIVSEKVVRRIMKEEELAVHCKNTKDTVLMLRKSVPKSTIL